MFFWFYLTRFSHHIEDDLASHSGGGSGGYLEFVARHAVQEIQGSQLSSINYKVLRYYVFHSYLFLFLLSLIDTVRFKLLNDPKPCLMMPP